MVHCAFYTGPMACCECCLGVDPLHRGREVGEVAALVTSICWSLTSIQFTLAGRQIGSQAVNRFRLLLAVVVLLGVHTVLYGRPLPAGVDGTRWAWLGLSGLAGLLVGDGCLFQAFLLIGPRRSMLLMTLVPVISALLAWAWFGETIAWLQLLAIAVTMAGVGWVVSEQQGAAAPAPADKKTYLLGVLFGLGGAAGQAVGLILSKQGLSDEFSALSATLIRMLVAAAAIWLLEAARGRLRGVRPSGWNRQTRLLIAGGVLTGPTLGVWLSMVAVQRAQVGVASTLMSLSPVMMLPLAYRILGERITARTIAGTVVALSGAAALFWL